MNNQQMDRVPATKIYTDYFREHAEVLAAVESSCAAALNSLAERCATALLGGCKILFFGNGGSAADAQHLATELSSDDLSPTDARSLAWRSPRIPPL